MKSPKNNNIWFRRFLNNKGNRTLILCLALLVVCAFIGPLFLQDSSKIDLFNTLQNPLSPDHLLGTDDLGRDLLAGLVNGLKLALKIGLLASIISVIIGSSLGLLCTFYGDDQIKYSLLDILSLVVLSPVTVFYSFLMLTSLLEVLPYLLIIIFSIIVFLVSNFFLFKISSRLSNRLGLRKFNLPLDSLFGRFLEVFNSMPKMLLILVCTLFFKEPSSMQVAFILGLTSWTGIARLTRGEVLKLKYQDFIESAKSIGVSDLRLLLNYIFPNTLTPVLITIAFTISGAVLFEASLSFLGLGVPVEEVSLGSLLMQGRQNMDAWWLVVFPGIVLFILVTLLNLIGRSLSKSFNEK